MQLQYQEIIDQALMEDLAWGDVTTDALIDPSQFGTAYIKSKSEGILSGIEIAKSVFLKVDPEIEMTIYLKDGSAISSGDKIAKLAGHVSSILKAERVALNFLQHLSGIASQTSLFVEAVKGLPVRIADTRKTIPGLRLLEKKAVRDGGGINHRINLSESILIKNNHLKTLLKTEQNIKSIIYQVKRQNALLKKVVEIEVESVQDAIDAVEAGADIVMLDNMTIKDMSTVVSSVKGKAIIEASGGICLDNVTDIARTGVDVISIGALTHSSRAVDISLTIE